MTKKIDMMSPATGRMLGEDDSTINVAEQLKGINEKLGAGGNLGGNPISETNPLPITVGTDAIQKIAVTIPLNGMSTDEITIPPGYRLSIIEMPAAWTAATLAFTSASVAAGTHARVYESGREVYEPAAASRTITIAANALALEGITNLKIWSGTSDNRIAQAAARTLNLTLSR